MSRGVNDLALLLRTLAKFGHPSGRFDESTAITDKGLGSLTALRLTRLGRLHMANNARLTEVWIAKSKVPLAGVMKLNEALPKCRGLRLPIE